MRLDILLFKLSDDQSVLDSPEFASRWRGEGTIIVLDVHRSQAGHSR